MDISKQNAVGKKINIPRSKSRNTSRRDKNNDRYRQNQDISIVDKHKYL